MDLLDIKKAKKKSNPDFIRQDAHKKSKLAKKWRKPRGHQSKLRQQLKGYRKVVKEGYKMPIAVRHTNIDGLKLIKINNMKDLEKIDPKKDAVVISSNIGFKKKKEILAKCIELKIKIQNISKVQEYLEQKTKQIQERKDKQKQKKQTRETKKSDKKEKKEKKTVEETLTEEEKKEEDKKEKDKILTKKDGM